MRIFLSLSFILLALTSLTVIERGVRTIQLVFCTFHQWVLSHTRPFKLLRQRNGGEGFKVALLVEIDVKATSRVWGADLFSSLLVHASLRGHSFNYRM